MKTNEDEKKHVGKSMIGCDRMERNVTNIIYNKMK